MKGIHPGRRIALMALSFALVGGAYFFYYAPLERGYAEAQDLIERENNTLASLGAKVQTLKALEADLAKKRDDLQRWQEHLSSAPELKQVLKQLLADLETRGLHLASFNPAHRDEQAVPGVGIMIRERFQIIFESSYAQLAEILEGWEGLDFDLRLENVALATSDRGAGVISVSLDCNLLTLQLAEEER